MARISLSKKTRFEVFKRDGFTCTYCGRRPPAAILECDHIVAVAAGGTNTTDNLTTACFDCNSGKGARALDALPSTIADKAELLAEKREQLRAFERLLKAERKRIEASIDAVQAELFPEETRVFTSAFRTSVRGFLGRLPLSDLILFAQLAVARAEFDQRTRYFCGCCWRKIKGDDRGGRYGGEQ